MVAEPRRFKDIKEMQEMMQYINSKIITTTYIPKKI
jgi:hypothetical protein